MSVVGGSLAYCDTQFLVGKAVGLDLMQGKSEPPRKPPRRLRSGRQALKRGRGHGLRSPGEPLPTR